MAWVSRQEVEQIERRLFKAEQIILRQETQIKYLQARIEGPVMAPAFNPMVNQMAAIRDRSRTPTPMNPPRLPPKTNGPMMSVVDFAMQNNLDEKSTEALNNQPEEVQKHVIIQGPVDGRNPSAMVMGRIARATSEILVLGRPAGGTAGALRAAGFSNAQEVTAAVEDFILSNGLDEKVSESLRTATPECQAAVIGQGAADGRNPSAMVMGRIAKFQRGEY